MIPRAAFLDSRLGTCSGLSFVDATRSAICHHRPINSHKVLCGVAKRGQTSGGRCSGCKVHLVINDCGALLAVALTPGQVDDRRPVAGLSRKLCGQLLGDRGSSSQELCRLLSEQGVQLLTKLQKNLKNKLIWSTNYCGANEP